MPLFLVGLLLLLAGCATPNAKLPSVNDPLVEKERIQQQAIALRYEGTMHARVSSVLTNIAAANVDICRGPTSFSAGFGSTYIADPKSTDGKIEGLAYGLGAGWTVISITTPAEEAGLRVGDLIAEYNGAPITRTTSRQEIVDILHEIQSRGEPIELKVWRGSEDLPISITPRKICGYDAAFVKIRSDVNAFADGNSVTVTSGMLDFLRSDDELALILGHELAHNIRGHIKAQQGNYRVGELFGLLVTVLTGHGAIEAGGEIGKLMFSKDFEAEADYVGTYLAARAGYDVNRAAELWRRMAALHPEGIHAGPLATHPDTARRFLLIEQAAAEIETKKAKGEPLLPNLKQAESAARPPT